MEGSGSGSKRGGEGLPPIVPRSSRRRIREENPNEESSEMFVEANLQPQPQQVQGGGEMEPSDLRSRLANRRYSEAFRHRRQNYVQQLEALATNLEAENVQSNTIIDRKTAESSEILQETAVLKKQFDASAANLQSKEAETQRIRDDIMNFKRERDTEELEIANTMITDPNYMLFEESFSSRIYSARQNQPNILDDDDDEAGPSGNINPDDSM